MKLKDVKTEVIQEDDNSHAIVCSALGVYSVGRTLREAKRNFKEALDPDCQLLERKQPKK